MERSAEYIVRRGRIRGRTPGFDADRGGDSRPGEKDGLKVANLGTCCFCGRICRSELADSFAISVAGLRGPRETATLLLVHGLCLVRFLAALVDEKRYLIVEQ